MAQQQKKAHPSHLQTHAHELITKHGPRTVSMIAFSFSNIGNYIPGTSPAEQWAAVEKELLADPRIVKTADNDGVNNDWYGLKEAQEGEDNEGD